MLNIELDLLMDIDLDLDQDLDLDLGADLELDKIGSKIDCLLIDYGKCYSLILTLSLVTTYY